MASYLVTGASRGIGLELVKQLAERPSSDVSVVFAVTRHSSNLKPLQNLIFNLSGRIEHIAIEDMANHDEVVTAVKIVSEKLGGKGLDVLVNNAGVCPRTGGGKGKTEDLTVDDLTSTFITNVVTTQVVTASFLPLMRQGSRKTIVNMSTTLGSMTLSKFFAWAPTHSYKITKAAFNMLNQQYANDLEAEGFTVMAISPGWIKTDLGGAGADLEISVGVNAVMDRMVKATPEMNGKFFNVDIPDFKDAEGRVPYDGGEVPW